MTVLWPAWIRFSDSPELLTVHDQAEWETDLDLHAWSYEPADRLVDSSGNEFRLEMSGASGKREATLVPTGARYGADRIRDAVAQHVGALGGNLSIYLAAVRSCSEDEVASVTARWLEDHLAIE